MATDTKVYLYPYGGVLNTTLRISDTDNNTYFPLQGGLFHATFLNSHNTYIHISGATFINGNAVTYLPLAFQSEGFQYLPCCTCIYFSAATNGGGWHTTNLFNNASAHTFTFPSFSYTYTYLTNGYVPRKTDVAAYIGNTTTYFEDGSLEEGWESEGGAEEYTSTHPRYLPTLYQNKRWMGDGMISVSSAVLSQWYNNITGLNTYSDEYNFSEVESIDTENTGNFDRYPEGDTDLYLEAWDNIIPCYAWMNSVGGILYTIVDRPYAGQPLYDDSGELIDSVTETVDAYDEGKLCPRNAAYGIVDNNHYYNSHKRTVYPLVYAITLINNTSNELQMMGAQSGTFEHSMSYGGPIDITPEGADFLYFYSMCDVYNGNTGTIPANSDLTIYLPSNYVVTYNSYVNGVYDIPSGLTNGLSMAFSDYQTSDYQDLTFTYSSSNFSKGNVQLYDLYPEEAFSEDDLTSYLDQGVILTNGDCIIYNIGNITMNTNVYTYSLTVNGKTSDNTNANVYIYSASSYSGLIASGSGSVCGTITSTTASARYIYYIVSGDGYTSQSGRQYFSSTGGSVNVNVTITATPMYNLCLNTLASLTPNPLSVQGDFNLQARLYKDSQIYYFTNDDLISNGVAYWQVSGASNTDCSSLTMKTTYETFSAYTDGTVGIKVLCGIGASSTEDETIYLKTWFGDAAIDASNATTSNSHIYYAFQWTNTASTVTTLKNSVNATATLAGGGSGGATDVTWMITFPPTASTKTIVNLIGTYNDDTGYVGYGGLYIYTQVLTGF